MSAWSENNVASLLPEICYCLTAKDLQGMCLFAYNPFARYGLQKLRTLCSQSFLSMQAARQAAEDSGRRRS